MMAASAPAPNVTENWIDSQRSLRSSEEVSGTRGLELKMSGMSLMSAYNNTSGISSFNDTPGLSGSIVSTYSNDDPLSRRQPNDSTDQSSIKGSTPSSPLQGLDQSFAKPPGLLPSPIGEPGHSKNNSSATSALVTLTPNSSVDGTSDLHSLERRQSPFQGDGPSMPFLRTENRRPQNDNVDFTSGLSNFGSFDVMDGDNDGLLGLDALRDRSYSSPGPAARGQAIGQHLETDSNRIIADSRRPRAGSRDNGARSSRPPLSGGSVAGSVGSVGSNMGGGGGAQSPLAEGHSNISSNSSLGGIVVPLVPGRNNDTSQVVNSSDAGDYRALGVISRPDIRLSSNDSYEESSFEFGGLGLRRSSIATETGREFNYSGYMNQNQSLASADRNQLGIDQSLAHKFGSMPTLSNHLQSQRVHSAPGQPNYNHLLPLPHQQRLGHGHGRSHSMSGAVPDQVSMYDNSSMARLPPGMENDNGQSRYRPVVNNGQHSRTMSDNFKPTMNRRSISMTGNMPSFDGSNPSHARRNSQPNPNMGGVPGYYGQHQSMQGMQPPLQGRDAREFVPGQGPVVASPEEMRLFGGNENERQSSSYNRQLSPAPSPLHSHYGGNQNRHPSANFSPLSLGSNMMGQDQQGYDNGQFDHNLLGHGCLEEDLSHPLAGEHIEVPADHSGDNMHPHLGGYSQYMLSQPYPGFDSAHHLPTAGAALPSPKVVYNVKFKRTQRSFVLGPRINRDLKIGTYVKVEADRGEDLGIVIGKIPAEKYNFSGRPGFRSNNMNEIVPSQGSMGAVGAADLKCIIRLATHDEVSLLSMKRDEEDELLKICRAKVRQRGLPMNVVDAEYQFDRHKLIFFFEAEGRIDFRELVRDLFSMYKTRIWMQQLDKNVTSSTALTVAAPPANMMDYGTPIIAPASEFSDSFPLTGLSSGGD